MCPHIIMNHIGQIGFKSVCQVNDTYFYSKCRASALYDRTDTATQWYLLNIGSDVQIVFKTFIVQVPEVYANLKFWTAQ